MNTKSFRSLIQDKTGLTDKEYDQLFDALQEKYNVTEESIANQIPDKFGAFDADRIMDIALPDTSNDNVELTKYDKAVADKLGIDADIVGKVTHWGAEASEKIDNVPFVGGQVKDMLEDNGLGDFIGSQREIGKAIDERLTPVAENTAEGATSDANTILQEKIESIKERFEGREVEEGTVELEKHKGFDYYNEEAGVALRGIGNSMRVYTINENGDTELVGKVDCAKENREEFVSEYKEQIDKVAEADDNFWAKAFGGKERVAMEVAQDVSKDIAEEHEIGTGNWLHDVMREQTEQKYENLQEKVENMEEKIENMDDGWLKDMMTKTLEKAQAELTQYEEQLEKFDQMEIENAKEIKAQVEAAKAELQEQMDKVDNMKLWPESMKEAIKSGMEAQMDELDDRLTAVNNHIASATETTVTPEIAAEAKQENNNWLENFKDKLEEKAQDAKEWISDAVADARAGAQSFVANVDNIIGGVKDDVAEWANSVAQNEHVQNFSETVNNFYDNIQDDLQGIKDATKDFGKEFSEDAGKLWEDVKDVAQDVGKDIADKWDNAVDNVKDWAKDIADKFDFDKDDDVAASIDD